MEAEEDRRTSGKRKLEAEGIPDEDGTLRTGRARRLRCAESTADKGGGGDAYAADSLGQFNDASAVDKASNNSLKPATTTTTVERGSVADDSTFENVISDAETETEPMVLEAAGDAQTGDTPAVLDENGVENPETRLMTLAPTGVEDVSEGEDLEKGACPETSEAGPPELESAEYLEDEGGVLSTTSNGTQAEIVDDEIKSGTAEDGSGFFPSDVQDAPETLRSPDPTVVPEEAAGGKQLQQEDREHEHEQEKDPGELCLQDFTNISRMGAEATEDQGAAAQEGVCSGCGCSEKASEAGPSCQPLQLLVKLFDGRTVLIRADPSETAELVLERVRAKTGVDCLGQRLLYNGRELYSDEPLAQSSSLQSGCTLTLTARLRSSAFPWAFTLTERLLHYAKVALDPSEKPGRREVAANTVTNQVSALLDHAGCMRTPRGEYEWGSAKAGVVDVFRTLGGPRMLHALLQAPDEFCRRCAEDCIRGFITELHISYIVKGRLGCYCLPILADVWAMLLSDDSGRHVELYERVSSALLDTLASKSQSLICAYFRFSKQEALECFVGMLEKVKDRLCARLDGKQEPSDSLSINGERCSLQPLPEAKGFGVLCHVVVTAMQAAADEIVHTSDNVVVDSRGERQYTQADWEEGGLWSRLGEVWVRIQKVVDFKLYLHVASCWFDTSAQLALLSKKCQSREEAIEHQDKFIQALLTDDTVKQAAKSALGGRIYPIIDGLNAFNFGGEGSPFYNRFSFILAGHEAEIDAVAYTCFESNGWMFDEPTRRHLSPKTCVSWFLKQFPEPEEGADRLEIMAVRGPQFLRDTLAMLDDETSDLSKLQQGLGVQFDGEEAEGPGVLREWFALVARELFSEEKGLFIVAPGDRRRVLPNPESEKVLGEAHLDCMRLAGHVLGLAILHRFPLGVLLSIPFYKALTGQPICWTDARDISPDLFNSCQKVMDLPGRDVEGLGLTFSADLVRHGVLETVDLVANGSDIVVTEGNREEYLDRLVTWQLTTQCVRQTMKFYQGLSDVISAGQSLERALTIVGSSELDGILSNGDPQIDVSDWKLHTEYSGYLPTCDQVRWFWQAVEEMTSEQRQRLLYFATAVAHLPLSGFRGLPHPFRLHKAYVDESWLPTAHTCFHLFMLPPYSSYEMLRSRLLLVTQDHIVEGFGFV